jgi:hypothetical protein
MDRLTIEGSKLTAHPPTTPGGPPDGRTAIREIKFTIAARESQSPAGARAFITTPPVCPSAREWTSRGMFGFANGIEETVTSTTPCAPLRSLRPTATVSVTPKAVTAGRRTSFSVRVSSKALECRQGLLVRLGDGRATTDANGVATVTTTLWQPGRRRVRIRQPGCLVRTASVRVGRAGRL